jgi:hypothetical protein
MTLNEFKRAAKKAGISGNGGGWFSLPGNVNVQSWDTLKRVIENIGRKLPANLAEIAAGRRIGVPTLNALDREELAAGVLSGKPVAWRRIPGKA